MTNPEGSTTSLSVVCSFWREFDLESRRPHLDELGLKIAEYQEDAQQNRCGEEIVLSINLSLSFLGVILDKCF